VVRLPRVLSACGPSPLFRKPLMWLLPEPLVGS
jgi:hypothetical protein